MIDCMVPKRTALKLHKRNGLLRNDNDNDTNDSPPPTDFYFCPLRKNIHLTPDIYNKF